MVGSACSAFAASADLWRIDATAGGLLGVETLSLAISRPNDLLTWAFASPVFHLTALTLCLDEHDAVRIEFLEPRDDTFEVHDPVAVEY